MHSVTRLPQLFVKFVMLTSVCHGGRGRSGLVAGRSWAFKPPDIRGRRSFGVLRLLAQSRRFGNNCLPAAGFGFHHAFVDNFASYVQDAKLTNFQRLSLNGNFSATAFSPENLSDKALGEDFMNFRPPPPAPPISPEELLPELPFHYWYSYADLPDKSSRKKRTSQKKLEELKSSPIRESGDTFDPSSLQSKELRRSLIKEPRDISVSSSAQEEEPRELSDLPSPQAEERRGSAMGEFRKNSRLSDPKPGEPRRSLMKESRETADSHFSPRQRRRFLVKEPKVTADPITPHRGKGIATIDSVLQLDSSRSSEGCLTVTEVQDTTGIVGNEEIVTLELAEKLEDRSDEARWSGGKSEEEEYERTASARTTEGACTEKEAFRLSTKEINLLVDKCNRSNRQINIGWRGWGHNYITLVHSYWKRSEVCKIKCKGAVTLDMDFLCNKLEEKTGGRVIHRNLGVVYLYRGRDYDPTFARKLPVRHQRRKTPAKRLAIPFGLTKDDVNAMRDRGKELPALCKLAKNGVYVTLLDDIRKAFEKSDLVRVNCQGFEARNFRALGVKLKMLVPCVLISYEFEHILMWRWDSYKVPSREEATLLAEESFMDDEEDVEH